MTALVTPPSGLTPEACEARDVPYEVVNGAVVELPPMGSYAVWLATILQTHLGPFARDHNLGRVMHGMLFRIDRRGTSTPAGCGVRVQWALAESAPGSQEIALGGRARPGH